MYCHVVPRNKSGVSRADVRATPAPVERALSITLSKPELIMANQRIYSPWLLAACTFLLAFGSPATRLVQAQTGQADRPAAWQMYLAKELPLLGHRNWIVIADSAYPAQAREGIKTIYIGGDQLAAVRTVLQSVDAARHVRGIVYVDQELEHVSDDDAAGIDAYREQLHELLRDRPVRQLPHEEIIEQLDMAAETFRVIILKTDLTIPYTSVFIQLDCGYWSSEAEQQLRKRMEDAK